MKKAEQTLEDALLRVHDEKVRFAGFWEGIQQITTTHFQKKQHEHHETMSSLKHVTNREKLFKGVVINPDHPLKLCWDLFVGIFILYSVIIIPYRVGFNVSPTPREAHFDLLITALFALDIAVTFNTAYLDTRVERLEYQRWKIARHYLQFWFWIDILATFPFDGLADSAVDSINISAVRIIRILRLVRLFKLYRLLTRDKILRKLHIHPEVINLIGLVLQIFFIAHVIACFWHYVALPDVSTGFEHTWLVDFHFQDVDLGTRYIAALYFTFVTMLTIGYGDIRATNQIERLYAIFTMLVGAMVFGALVQKLASIMNRLNPKSKVHQEQMYQMKLFLVSMKIPVEIRDKAKASYSYFLTKKTYFGESESFESLPYEMLHDLVHKLYAQEISVIRVFKQMESAFIVHILSKARPMVFSRDEVIHDEGDVCNNIFFLKHGVVRLSRFNGQDHEVVGCVTAGDYFGDSEYYLKSTALTRYTAVKNCHMIVVSHAVITEALGLHHGNSTTFSTFLKVRSRELKKVLQEKSSRQRSKLNIQHVEVLAKELSTGNDDDDDAADLYSAAPTGSRGILLSSLATPSRRKSLVKKMSQGAQLLYRDGHRADLASSLHFLFDIEEEENQVYREDHRKQHQVLDINLFDEHVQFAEWSLQDFRRRGLIHPAGKYKSMWDLYVSLLIVYSCFLVPVEIAFQQDAFQHSAAVNLFISGCFFVDMVLWFRTCFVSHQHDALIVSSILIIRNYLFGWFVVDLFSMVPIDLILRLSSSSSASSLDNLAFAQLIKTVRLLRLARIARVMKLNLFLDKLEERFNISPVVFELLTMSVQVFFIVHLVCCLWWGLTDFVATRDTSIWYDSFVQPDASVASKYLLCIYFTYTTFTTVGYGDILPTSNAERVLAIFLVLIGASIFGYMIAKISSMLSSSDDVASLAHGKIGELQDYLTEKSCSSGLSQKIVDHFVKKYKSQTSYDLNVISNSLPPQICCDILCCVFAKAMDRIAMLKFIQNKTIALKIFQLLKVSYYGEDSGVIREGQECEEMYFVVQGNARAYRLNELKRSKGMARTVQSSSMASVFDSSSPGKLRKGSSKYLPKRARSKSQHVSTKRDIPHNTIVDDGSSGSSEDVDEADIITMDFARANNSPLVAATPNKAPSRELQKELSRAFANISEFSQSPHASDAASSPFAVRRQISTRAPLLSSTPIVSVDASAVGSSSSSSTNNNNPEEPSTHRSSWWRRIEAVSPRLYSALTKLYSTAMYMPLKTIINSADPLFSDMSQGISDQAATPKSMSIEELERCGYKYVGDMIEGDFFGHVAFMTDTKHDCTVRTLTASTIYILHKGDLANLIRVEPSIAIQLQSALARSIIAQSDTVGSFHAKSARAKFLKELKDKYFALHQDEGNAEDAAANTEGDSHSRKSRRISKRINLVKLLGSTQEQKNQQVERLFDDEHLWQDLDPADANPLLGKVHKSKSLKIPAFLRPPLQRINSMRWRHGLFPTNSDNNLKVPAGDDSAPTPAARESLEMGGSGSAGPSPATSPRNRDKKKPKLKKKPSKRIRSYSLSEIDFAASYMHPSPWDNEEERKHGDLLLLVTEDSLTSGHKSVNFGAKGLPRRQSFPSTDNKMWQETIKHQGLL